MKTEHSPMTETRISQWGHSLGVRIPKDFVDKLNLKNGSEVRMYEDKNRIIIEKEKHYTLQSLLKGVKECPYEEVETDYPRGVEVW